MIIGRVQLGESIRLLARDFRFGGIRHRCIPRQCRIMSIFRAALMAYVRMNLKVVVAVLLIAVVPVYAQAQSPSAPKVKKGDAQKVVTIISGDKVKTETYCDIQKLAEQMAEAHEKKDSKTVIGLFQKIEALEKILGPEYAALIDGVQDIAENDQLRAELLSAFEALARLCTR